MLHLVASPLYRCTHLALDSALVRDDDHGTTATHPTTEHARDNTLDALGELLTLALAYVKRVADLPRFFWAGPMRRQGRSSWEVQPTSVELVWSNQGSRFVAQQDNLRWFTRRAPRRDPHELAS